MGPVYGGLAFPLTRPVHFELQADDASLAKAIDLGGAMAMDKMANPGVGTAAYVFDPEANVVGMIQPES